jgi:glyoxylate/hydroxypyruvate reductase A
LAPHLPTIQFVDLMSDDAMQADIALVWAPPSGRLAALPKLRGIIMQGQGVDHMMADASVPRDIPLVRLVDPDMSAALSHWAILAALDFWRDGSYYRAQQRQKIWASKPQRPAQGGVVGIMGVGAIGSVIAARFAGLGFRVKGWARTPRQLDQVAVYAGMDELDDFLQDVQILVSVLPLTPETRGIMNADLFAKLAPGACVINGGRGPQIVDDDLLAALDSGQVGAAVLDVFATEPLPEVHPFWSHDKVTVWPHVAAQTNPETAAQQVAAAIDAMMAGKAPANQVDWQRGY